MINLATFGYDVVFFSQGSLSFLFREFLNWSDNESKSLSLYDQSRQGRVLELSPWRVRGYNWIVDDFERECLVFYQTEKYAVPRLMCVTVKNWIQWNTIIKKF